MSNVLKALMSGGAAPLYVDDVFSAYVYTGNGSTQTITNGIDLAGNGGLVWLKKRNGAGGNYLYDTVRGAGKELVSNGTSSQGDNFGDSLTGFNSVGFSLGSGASGILINDNGLNYASWTFRKAPKFFDVVTYTGNGAANRNIAHSLGVAPGMVIVKRTDSTSDWMVNAQLNGSSAAYLKLNSSGSSASVWAGEVLSLGNSTTFGVGTGGTTDTNANTVTYVAYLFAHDPAADGIIQCGSFTTDGSGNATVNLGWELQFVLMKSASGGTSDWFISDNMRNGLTANNANNYLRANTSAIEVIGAGSQPSVTATGFTITGSAANYTFIYLAIRRPNKPPTSGTEVYNAIARTGTGAAATVTGVGFAPDALIASSRTPASGLGTGVWDRLRGVSGTANKTLIASSTGAEQSGGQADVSDFNMDGFNAGNSAGWGITNRNGTTYINWFFRRAPGVFDVVCYTGTGVARTVVHNLGVAPELMIVKWRNSTGNWLVWCSQLGANDYLLLNSTAAKGTESTMWNGGGHTSTIFSIGTHTNANNSSSDTYVAYLFATKAGISFVGSYTGNGTSQTVNCGFSAGARFVLIKATSTTGSWTVLDTTRGIVAASDPYLLLNSTAAEVTTEDCCDPDSSGFVVNSTTASLNTNGVSYIFLALA